MEQTVPGTYVDLVPCLMGCPGAMCYRDTPELLSWSGLSVKLCAQAPTELTNEAGGQCW